MKKWLMAVGLIVGLYGLSHAGGPQETFYSGQAPMYSTEIVGSTATLVGNVTITASVVPGSYNNGGQSQTCRNCFTKFLVQIPTSTILNILDGGTTVQVVNGAGLGTTGTNTLAMLEDHLGPLCFTYGNTTNFNIVGGGLITTNPQVFDYEGYITCGAAGGSTNNIGR